MILSPTGRSAGMHPDEHVATAAVDVADASADWAQVMAYEQWNQHQQQDFTGMHANANNQGFASLPMGATGFVDTCIADGAVGLPENETASDAQLDELFSELQADFNAHNCGSAEGTRVQPTDDSTPASVGQAHGYGRAFFSPPCQVNGGMTGGPIMEGGMHEWMQGSSGEAMLNTAVNAEEQRDPSSCVDGEVDAGDEARQQSENLGCGSGETTEDSPENQDQEQGVASSRQVTAQEDTQGDGTQHRSGSLALVKFTPPLSTGRNEEEWKADNPLGGRRAGAKKAMPHPGAVVVELSSSSSSGHTIEEDNDLSVVSSRPSTWAGDGRQAKRRRKAVLHPLAATSNKQGGPQSSSSQGDSRNGSFGSDPDDDVVVLASRGATRVQQFTNSQVPHQQLQQHGKQALMALTQHRWHMQTQHDPRQAKPDSDRHNGSFPRDTFPKLAGSMHRSAFRSPVVAGQNSSQLNPALSAERSLVPVSRTAQPEPQEFQSILEGLTFSGTSHEVEMEEGLLSVPLLKHQKLAVGWMEQREQSYPAGGILADDQGLGKTVSTIALIVRCHHRRKQQSLGAGDLAGSQESQNAQAETLNSTRAVGSEGTEEKPAGSQLTPDAQSQVKPKAEVVDLDDDDVTSPRSTKAAPRYASAEIPQVKAEPGIPAGMSKQRSRSGMQGKRLPGGTLVVCPTSVLWQWEKELRAKLGPSCKDLSVLVYHGVNRSKRTAAEVASYGVVLTTYAIVGLDVPRAEGGRGAEEKERKEALGLPTGKGRGIKAAWAALLPEAHEQRQQQQQQKVKRGAGSEGLRGPLACIAWHRVVLDEAQCIKNRSTQMAFACWGLRAKRRWCLSGTPIQNTVDDIYSYFRFLRYSPYDDYATFRAQLKDPTTGMPRLQAVLKAIMLRRTKTTKLEGKPIIQLPQRMVTLCEIEFSREERQMYTNLEVTSKAQFQNFAKSGSLKKHYMSILVMLLRLRQFCNHPNLLNSASRSALVFSNTGSAAAQPSAGRALSLPLQKRMQLLSSYQEGGGLCGACGDLAAEAPAVTKCGHTFCLQCILQHLVESDAATCPTCLQQLTTNHVFAVSDLESAAGGPNGRHSSSLGDVSGGQGSLPGHADGVVMSAKTRELLKLLLALPFVPCQAPGKTPLLLPPSSGVVDSVKEEKVEHVASNGRPLVSASTRMYREKAIVFSQWSSMLDLVEEPLKSAGLLFVRLDGSMSCAERDQAVTKFVSHPEITVMLMSLKAASLGLNLVVARHVVLLDLWWNPSTEEQAIDRAHRIGQTRTVHVARFAVKDTIEDRILELQARKRTMVASAFGESPDGQNATRLTMDDLEFLFSSGRNL